MYLIEPKRHGAWVYDPGISMALQEYVKDHIFLDDDVLFTYMMNPVVQRGKFQNPYEQVKKPYIEANEIQFVSRVNVGGSIYVDDRNMSFCFLLDGDKDFNGNYALLYEPVMKVLKKLGVHQLEQKGRNDLDL